MVTLCLTIGLVAGCSSVKVTQKTKTVEAGTENVDPITLVEVAQADKYEVSVGEGKIDTSKLGKYDVKYIIKDKESGKSNEKTFTYEVTDTTKPKVEFKTEAISISQGDKFDPLQYITITDNYDKAIDSSKVVVESNVDSAKIGEYSVTYNVSDASGNKETASVQVKVEQKAIKLGEEVSTDKIGAFTIKSTRFTKKVEPSNATGFYMYYTEKESDKLYFDIAGTYKNLGTDSVQLDDVLKVELQYDGSYNYDGFAVSDEDGNLNAFSFVDPLGSTKFHYLISVPSELKDSGKPIILKITLQGAGDKRFVVR